MNCSILAATSQMQKAWNLYRVLTRRDIQTGEHSLNVACMAKVFSHYVRTDLGKEKIFIAGLLHDVGKIKMPDFVFQNYIIDSEEDKRTIREHPKYTKLILENMGFDGDIVGAAYAHHERWDGQGYPLALAGESIQVEGRLLSIIDSYSAITEDRPYRKGAEIKQAVDILVTDKDRYDLELLTAFIKNINAIVNSAKLEAEKHKRELKKAI